MVSEQSKFYQQCHTGKPRLEFPKNIILLHPEEIHFMKVIWMQTFTEIRVFLSWLYTMKYNLFLILPEKYEDIVKFYDGGEC